MPNFSWRGSAAEAAFPPLFAAAETKISLRNQPIEFPSASPSGLPKMRKRFRIFPKNFRTEIQTLLRLQNLLSAKPVICH